MRPTHALRRVAPGLAAVALAVSLTLAAGCAGRNPRSVDPAPASAPSRAAEITFLGEALVPKELPPGIAPAGGEAAPVGGLSGLVFDPATGDYLAISDSRGEHGPVRIYRLAIDLQARGAGAPVPELAADGARVLAVTELMDRDGKPFREGTADPEGIALAPGGGVYVSSEGITRDGIAPFVRRFAADGRMIDALPLPAAYLPRDGRHPRGVRNNLGFEPLGVTPATAPAADSAGDPADEAVRYLFTGTENALAQDGPKATVEHGSSSRLLRWALAADGTATGPPVEWIYPVAPVAEAPPPSHPQPDGLPVSGLVELIALGPTDLLTLERSYTDGAGTTVRLYRTRLSDATPISGRRGFRHRARHWTRPWAAGPQVPAEKTLLLDVSAILTAHNVPTDNLEGMTFGPALPDGRRLLLLVSDDNFSATQRTQVVAFSVPAAL